MSLTKDSLRLSSGAIAPWPFLRYLSVASAGHSNPAMRRIKLKNLTQRVVCQSKSLQQSHYPTLMT